jgi:hypothetical protein
MAKDKTNQKHIGQPDLREIAELHSQAAKKLVLLLDEHQTLLDAGKKVAAKAALQRAEKLQTVVRATEAKMKQQPDS